MRPAASALAGMLALFPVSAPAWATGTVACKAPGAAVSAELSIGHVPGLAVIGARLEADGRRWATDAGSSTPIALAQAFTDGTLYWIDFADGNVEEMVAELRLARADEGRQAAMAGTLRIAGIGAWPVVCMSE